MAGGSHQYLAIHGHFYQPPREDPFTGRLPRERGAEPFRNFNEKIAAECYRPNAELGNYERISFDLGPTLASWLERYTPNTYAAIVAQERAHFERHGLSNAMAQVYSHAIMPLATAHEQRIQAAWGIADFRHRFGHAPDGMWLAETAADSVSLGVLLDHGIEYTVLAPWQAVEPIDPSEPYWVRLADGRRIAAFFYHGELSGRVSFDSSLTTNADVFGLKDLPRHVDRERAARGDSQLILIATDGELYGHHLPYRDKFLAHLLEVSAISRGFEVTSLGRFLAAHPPRREVTLAEATSWSCHHGVDRWRGNCACIDGDGEWKWYLRQALTRLATRLDTLYDAAARRLLRDPWIAEEEYIWVRLGETSREAFWSEHARDQKSGSRRAFALLQAQYYRHLMFASCAWFFEDLDRIEPRNAIGYGLRALREAERVHRLDLLTAYASDLRSARSAETGRTGAELLEDIVARATGWSAGDSAAASDRTGARGEEPAREIRDNRDVVVVA
jgi:alpha-amylase/alpha-mannosidase (GH57 family)